MTHPVTRPRLVRSPTTGMFAIAALCIATVIVLLVFAGNRTSAPSPDIWLATWFADHRTDSEDAAGLLLAHVTTPLVLITGTIVVALVLWSRRWRAEAVVLTASVLIAYGISGIMKVIVHRARPMAPLNLSPESEGSFPSGHVIVVATLALVALVIAWPRLSVVGRWIWTSTATIVIVAICVDRLLVGAHWVTDVLASLSLAALIAVGAAYAIGRLRSPVGERT